MDLVQISKILSERLNEPIEIDQCELHASGYRSDGFKLTAKDGRQFFLKHIREADCLAGGYELPERRINSLLLSHRMSVRADVSPRSLGVWIQSGNSEPHMLPDIAEDSKVYQIQEFEAEGASYKGLLDDRSTKRAVDDQDRRELNRIVDYITRIHAIRNPAAEEDKLRAVYNDGLYSHLASPELTFALLQRFGPDDPILPLAEHGEYIGMVLQNLRTWMNRSDRLRALHGDFWAGNIFFRLDDTLWAVDYSFIPWGDPGIDIGHWTSVLMWYYHTRKNRYYRDLAEEFLELYERKTGDREILKALCLGYGMISIAMIAPGLMPDNDDLAAKSKFFENAKAVLGAGKLVWYD